MTTKRQLQSDLEESRRNIQSLADAIASHTISAIQLGSGAAPFPERGLGAVDFALGQLQRLQLQNVASLRAELKELKDELEAERAKKTAEEESTDQSDESFGYHPDPPHSDISWFRNTGGPMYPGLYSTPRRAGETVANANSIVCDLLDGKSEERIRRETLSQVIQALSLEQYVNEDGSGDVKLFEHDLDASLRLLERQAEENHDLDAFERLNGVDVAHADAEVAHADAEVAFSEKADDL